ncbi:unnamed protein product, partial [Choristocarpus tenellus]
MCGRARVTVEPTTLANAAGLPSGTRLRRASQYRPRHNAHPGNAAPVLYTTNGGGFAMRAMRWGLVPSYTKHGERPNHFRMFNARSETVRERAAFSRLVTRRRCVVGFDGFYEWKSDQGGQKQPYYIRLNDDRPMLVAALYDTWRLPDEDLQETGKDKERFGT